MTQRMRFLRSASLAVAILSLAAGFCSAREARPTLLDSRAASKGVPTERFYVAVPGGDEDRLVSLFHKLDAAGASRMHAFLPDLIVCEIPVTVSAYAIANDPGVVVARASDAPQMLSNYSLRTRPATIERAYAEIKTMREMEKLGIATEQQQEAYPSESRPIPAEAMFESARRAASRSPRATAGAEFAPVTDARLIHQNSELLIGNILINLILPESDMNNPYWYLNWTPEAIDQVHLGFFFAMENFMDDYSNADVGVIYKYHDQVLVRTEPIRHTVGNSEFWITLCMNQLGYFGSESEVLHTVHEFNDDARRRTGADWAFAAFVAQAVGNWYGSTFYDARVLSWSYVGGPYFVTSYPAGHLYASTGQTLVARHEIGHLFWGLEENAGPMSECGERSGYLDIVHGNKVTAYDPIYGIPSGCGESSPVPCLMNEQYQLTLGFDPGGCTFSEQTWGVSDLNDNSVPDALDSPPIIEFLAADIETVLTQMEYFDVRVRSIPVPNINPRQPAGLRRDYAARIRDIDVDVGGVLPYTLDPSEIGSNGYLAEFRVDLPPFIPGRLDIDVGARNVYYAKSPTRTKQYRYVHLKYLGFEVEHPNDGIHLSWTMLGEIFDAHFALHRRDEDTGEEVIVIDGIIPTGPTESGITPFEAMDDDTEPGVRYTYWVAGTIDLPNSAGTIHKVVESKPIVVQGAVARTRTPSSSISNVAPNPFSTRTWLSMTIPHPESKAPTDGSNAAADAVLPVKITVFDVRGRLVSELFDRRVVDDVLTVSWDGTDDRGRSMPSGVYFIRVNVAGTIENRKVMLVH